METLHLDLTESATRQFILAELLGRLDEAGRASVIVATEAAGVADAHHHDLAAVTQAIDSATVSAWVAQQAHAVYNILANAEAQVHGCAVEATHFHEVGNGEAIRNVIAICLAIEALAPERITATAVQTGSGKIQCAHGLLDIPAPATAAIIARGIPACDTLLEGELCTPTSAAIILHFVNEFV